MTKYFSIIRENGEFEFEVLSSIRDLDFNEYEELKSLLITAIGTMEIMRREELPKYSMDDQVDY